MAAGPHAMIAQTYHPSGAPGNKKGARGPKAWRVLDEIAKAVQSSADSLSGPPDPAVLS